MEVNIGISPESREEISKILNEILASEVLLLIKTKNFHWNVKGPHFSEYHKFFDEQAEEIENTIDEVAERVRALGFHSLGSMQEYLENTFLDENTNRGVSAADMLKELLENHEAVIRNFREKIPVVSVHQDEGTADFLTGLMEQHEKMAWMLRSFQG